MPTMSITRNIPSGVGGGATERPRGSPGVVSTSEAGTYIARTSKPPSARRCRGQWQTGWSERTGHVALRTQGSPGAPTVVPRPTSPHNATRARPFRDGHSFDEPRRRCHPEPPFDQVSRPKVREGHLSTLGCQYSQTGPFHGFGCQLHRVPRRGGTLHLAVPARRPPARLSQNAFHCRFNGVVVLRGVGRHEQHAARMEHAARLEDADARFG